MEERKALVAMFENRLYYNVEVVFSDVNDLISKINVQIDRHGLEAPVVEIECEDLTEDEIVELQHVSMSVLGTY